MRLDCLTPMAPAPDPLLSLADSAEVRAYLSQPNTGVYVVRPDGHIVWASPSMGEVVGRAPEELVGRNGWDVFVPREVLPQVAEFRARLSEADGVLWMPLKMPGDGRRWYRVDTILRRGGIICAFHPEDDPAQAYVHSDLRPRRSGVA